MHPRRRCSARGRDASSRCDAIANDRDWLDCYYGAAQPMRARLGLSPAPARQQGLVPEPRAASGGFASWLGGGAPEHVRPRMVSYSYDSSGSFTVSLAGGETWRQMFGDPHIVRWKEPAAAHLVTIAPAALGSYDMRVEGDKRVYKVRRLH